MLVLSLGIDEAEIEIGTLLFCFLARYGSIMAIARLIADHRSVDFSSGR